MPERPFLTAEWRNLLLLNFPVPAELLARLAPPGTEPDLLDGQAYISIVGFRFERVRLLGLPFPGHTRFAEINLRYYVRRNGSGEPRRGVVFVREIAPRWAVVATANWLYNEQYITRRMRSEIRMAAAELNVGDTVEYAWRDKQQNWNRLAARVAAPFQLPALGSPETYFTENYWGYVRARDGTTREYRVAHDPWQVARADNVTWDCNAQEFSPPRPRGGALPAYDAQLAQYLAAPPASAYIAVGSPIQLYRGRRLN